MTSPLGQLKKANALRLWCGVCLGLAMQAQGRTINWGDAALGNDLTSDGTAIDVSFTFEIGTFGPSFVPDGTNVALWGVNWKPLDSATYNETLDFFTSSFQIEAHPTLPNTLVSDQNGTDTFAIGEQTYIWIFNTTVPGEAAEWALFTDNDTLNGDDWLLPDPGDQSTEPLDWRQSTATVPVFGGLNDVTGPGERSDTSTVFQFQTHTFVPEPSTALLLAGALGLLGARRRRVRNPAAESIR